MKALRFISQSHKRAFCSFSQTECHACKMALFHSGMQIMQFSPKRHKNVRQSENLFVIIIVCVCVCAHVQIGITH